MTLALLRTPPLAATPDPASNAGGESGDAILVRARQRAVEEGLLYAGGVTPTEAWALHRDGVGQIVDVRTGEERKFVGHVPGVAHVAWATGTSMTRNPRFVREVEAKFAKDDVLLLLCRSGKRSAAAGEALAKAGFTQVFNVLEGFEGDHNDRQQRGELGGWRRHGLPWIQD
ncbi:rhodanese-like domain-containing protein [Uliginosibacterium sp. sgz301328]|uniref:rhodanese-like domain-containing protein n=1 Tax=Uliginosibacterium sp. sgz301328 TaxID=3243764 RepID=UPI00359DF0CC